MHLFILRHGSAVEPGTSGIKSDSERPLTAEGKEQMKKVAGGMLKLGLAFDSILTSPYVRARQTAEIVAKTFQAEKRLKISEHLACEGSPKKLIQELKTLKAQDLLIVGHEPYLSGLISLLISGRSDLDINLKKAGLCRLSIDSLKYGRCARLDWLLTPNQLT